MGTTACAVAEGKAYCWGAGRRGQLGNGVRAYSYEAVAVDTSGVLAGQEVQALAVGGEHTCALANGTVFCWGDDSSGQTGNGVRAAGRSFTLVPAAVTGPLSAGSAVSLLAADARNTCAVADGVVYCWGANSYGQLGNGTRKRYWKAVRVKSKGAWGSQRVSAISAGRTHTCAVAAGRAFCWGTGDLGRPSVKRSTTPVRVPLAAKRVTGISAGPAEWVYDDPRDEVERFTGRTDTCAVANEQLFCWGWNSAGQLGIGHRRSTAKPTRVNGGDIKGKKVAAVSLSGESTARTCAIADGRAYCWGLGGLGVTGRRSLNLPVAVKRLPIEPVSEVVVGQNTCALVSGSIWCWGTRGQPLPRLVDVSSLKQPGRVVEIGHGGNWGVWATG